MTFVSPNLANLVVPVGLIIVTETTHIYGVSVTITKLNRGRRAENDGDHVEPGEQQRSPAVHAESDYRSSAGSAGRPSQNGWR